jgi:hypothetical protein
MLARRVLLRSRGFATHAAPAASAAAAGVKDVNVSSEIAMGLGLGAVLGGVWMIWAFGEYKKLDAFNVKLRAAKQQ